MRLIVVVISLWVVSASNAAMATPCEKSDEQFASEVHKNGFEVFLDRTESISEVWIAKLPQQFEGLTLNHVRLERTINDELGLQAYLNKRASGNIVWVSFAIPAQERKQYAVKAMYAQHPRSEHSCTHLLQLSLIE